MFVGLRIFQNALSGRLEDASFTLAVNLLSEHFLSLLLLLQVGLSSLLALGGLCTHLHADLLSLIKGVIDCVKSCHLRPENLIAKQILLELVESDLSSDDISNGLLLVCHSPVVRPERDFVDTHAIVDHLSHSLTSADAATEREG